MAVGDSGDVGGGATCRGWWLKENGLLIIDHTKIERRQTPMLDLAVPIRKQYLVTLVV